MREPDENSGYCGFEIISQDIEYDLIIKGQTLSVRHAEGINSILLKVLNIDNDFNLETIIFNHNKLHKQKINQNNLTIIILISMLISTYGYCCGENHTKLDSFCVICLLKYHSQCIELNCNDKLKAKSGFYEISNCPNCKDDDL